MPKKVREVHPPRGIGRLAFRLPLWLYRLGLGGLLGKRFVCLTHTGRKSGKPRQTVLEVVRYDSATGTCIVAAGFSERSDWVRNVTHNPHIVFTVGKNRRAGLAERLDPETAGNELSKYSHRYPLAWKELVRFMGYQLNGNEQDIHALGGMIPMFAFKPVDSGRAGIK
ncbi:MAG: nitroreductase family deazaflavin-dependent oxidoreductase [Chloroflexota bacterium]